MYGTPQWTTCCRMDRNRMGAAQLTGQNITLLRVKPLHDLLIAQQLTAQVLQGILFILLQWKCLLTFNTLMLL